MTLIKPMRLTPGNQTSHILWAVLILLVVLIALASAMPVLYPMPDTDASIFLFIGDKIKSGQLPFRDWYDHKPPLIFYLNALGLWLGQGSRWGVWAIEYISAATAALFGFVFLRRYYGKWIAALAVSAALMNLAFVFQRGNLTEEYALPFQFGTLFLLAGVDQGQKKSLRLFLIGLALSLASSLKQPLAGTGVAVGIYLFVYFASSERWRELLKAYGWILLGFTIGWVVWFAYFALIGIFPEFWEAAFYYNFALSGIPLEKRLLALLAAFKLLTSWSGFFVIGIGAWLVLLPSLFLQDERPVSAITSRGAGFVAVLAGLGLILKGMVPFDGRQSLVWLIAGLMLCLIGGAVMTGWARTWINPRISKWQVSSRSDLFLPMLIAAVDLPVEFALSSLSGNNFPHYFMMLLPSLTLLIAFVAHSVFRLAGTWAGKAMPYIWLLAIMTPIFVPGILKTADSIRPLGEREEVGSVVAYVEQNSQPNDYIFQWGLIPQVYQLSGRTPSSRYFFTDPLFVDGYSGRVQTSELLQDFKTKPPVLIIDQGVARLPLLIPTDPNACNQVYDPQQYETFIKTSREEAAYTYPRMPEGMDEVYYWICTNYTAVGPVGKMGWQVFRLKGK